VQVELFHRSKKQRDVLAYDFFRPETAPTGFLPEFSSIDTSAFSTVPPVKPVPSSKAKKRGGPPAVHIHHKFIIIDADTASPTIFTGSANMSKNSVERNDENLLEITNSPTLDVRPRTLHLKSLAEHTRVRIIALYGPPEAHLAHTDCLSLPTVGDEGTIVSIIAADGRSTGDPGTAGTRFFVESVASDGIRNWYAEFSSGELEAVNA